MDQRWTMSRHHPKRPQDKQSTHEKDDATKEKSGNLHVHIEPGVEIDLVQGLKEQRETERQETTTYNKKQLFWTKIAAGLVLAYATLTLWQGFETHKIAEISKNTFNAVNRPYVGIESVPTKRDDQKKTLQFAVAVKNFGSVPAERAQIRWKAFLGGQLIPGPRIPDSPASLFPGNTVYFRGE